MLEFKVALRNLTFRPVLTVITVVILGMAVGLAISIVLLAHALEEGLIDASRPFDLIIGAKGSANQLVMSTILLQEPPVGNISLEYFLQLREDLRVASVIALALGDNARGTPIVGVTPEFFELADPKSNVPYFSIASGKPIAIKSLDDSDLEVEDKEGHASVNEWEAVAGSRAARTWDINTTVQSSHGTAGEQPGTLHNAFYTIVGTLKPTNTPLDRAIFVPIQSYWQVHENITVTGSSQREITAIMVRPTGIREFYQLNQEFNEDDQTQAVLTGQGMARLFDLLDQGKNILGMVSYLALAMGAATVFLDIYAVGTQRRRETAILRSLGAGRWSVFGVAFIEALLTSALGILFGLTVGHLTAWVIAERIQDASAIYVNTTFVTSELAVAVAVLMLASAAGLIPAAQSYQQDVAANLT